MGECQGGFSLTTWWQREDLIGSLPRNLHKVMHGVNKRNVKKQPNQDKTASDRDNSEVSTATKKKGRSGEGQAGTTSACRTFLLVPWESQKMRS